MEYEPFSRQKLGIYTADFQKFDHYTFDEIDKRNNCPYTQLLYLIAWIISRQAEHQKTRQQGKVHTTNRFISASSLIFVFHCNTFPEIIHAPTSPATHFIGSIYLTLMHLWILHMPHLHRVKRQKQCVPKQTWTNFTTRKMCHAMCHIWNLGERWHQPSSRSQNWNLFKPNVHSCHCQTALFFLWATTYSSPSCGRLRLTFCIYWVTLQPLWAWEWHVPRFTTPIHHVKQHFNMLKTCDLAQLSQA